MKRILILGNIAKKGLKIFDNEHYEVASAFSNPDAIVVRSQIMHDMSLGDGLLAVGRAGAGVNNIPIDRLSELGVPVFNAPGANANAVKELVLASILIAVRNLYTAAVQTAALDLEGETLDAAVEASKKQFVGSELSSHVLGVIGLGAIGIEVANAALSLGMKVVGYDPSITIKNAWQVNSGIKQAQSLEQLLAMSDVVSVHVPLIEATKHLIDDSKVSMMKKGTTLLNFSRSGIVDHTAVLEGINSGKVEKYINDFPHEIFKGNDHVLSFPHLGASTSEAEINSARMVAHQIDDFIQSGNLVNAVNLPEASMPFSGTSTARLIIVNDNMPGMIEKISGVLREHGVNILDLLNKSKSSIAITLLDVDIESNEKVLSALKALDGIRSARFCTPRY